MNVELYSVIERSVALEIGVCRCTGLVVDEGEAEGKVVQGGRGVENVVV